MVAVVVEGQGPAIGAEGVNNQMAFLRESKREGV